MANSELISTHNNNTEKFATIDPNKSFNDDRNIQNSYLYKGFPYLKVHNVFTNSSNPNFIYCSDIRSNTYNLTDTWNNTITSRYSFYDTSINSDTSLVFIEPGTRPSFLHNLITAYGPEPSNNGSYYGTTIRVADNKLYITNFNDVDTDSSTGSLKNEVFEPSDFVDGVIPKRIIVELQAAGGAGSSSNNSLFGGNKGNGGAGGGYVALILNVDPSKIHSWNIELGSPGYGYKNLRSAGDDGKPITVSYRERNSSTYDVAYVVPGGKGGTQNGSSNQAQGGNPYSVDTTYLWELKTINNETAKIVGGNGISDEDQDGHTGLKRIKCSNILLTSTVDNVVIIEEGGHAKGYIHRNASNVAISWSGGASALHDGADSAEQSQKYGKRGNKGAGGSGGEYQLGDGDGYAGGSGGVAVMKIYY